MLTNRNEMEARHWGERLATWFESLEGEAQELVLRILAAIPGGEELADATGYKDNILGYTEGVILANYLRAALLAGPHVHEEVVRRYFLGEEEVEEEEE